jgi:hypothetical protein
MCLLVRPSLNLFNGLAYARTPTVVTGRDCSYALQPPACRHEKPSCGLWPVLSVHCRSGREHDHEWARAFAVTSFHGALAWAAIPHATVWLLRWRRQAFAALRSYPGHPESVRRCGKPADSGASLATTNGGMTHRGSKYLARRWEPTQSRLNQCKCTPSQGEGVSNRSKLTPASRSALFGKPPRLRL